MTETEAERFIDRARTPRWVPAPVPNLEALAPEAARLWEAIYAHAVPNDLDDKVLRDLDALGNDLDQLAYEIQTGGYPC